MFSKTDKYLNFIHFLHKYVIFDDFCFEKTNY